LSVECRLPPPAAVPIEQGLLSVIDV